MELDPTLQYTAMGALVLVIGWVMKINYDQWNFNRTLIGELLEQLQTANAVSQQTVLALQELTNAIQVHNGKMTEKLDRRTENGE